MNCVFFGKKKSLNEEMDPFQKAIEFIRDNKFVILQDDPEREDEADLVIHPDGLDAEKMAFMIRHSTGIVCVPITPECAERLNLPAMVKSPTDPFGTGFTISIDAKDGTTSGVSAQDRVITAKTIADPSASSVSFTRPGHMFPLVGRSGLLEERQGHTEGSLSLMQQSDKSMVAVIAELMNDDGTMMRNKELLAFSATHNIPIIRMSQLKSNPIPGFSPRRTPSCRLNIFNDFDVECIPFIYKSDTILVMIKGNIQNASNVPCRIHSGCLTGDIFSSEKCDCGDQLSTFLQVMAKSPCGILFYIPTHEGRGIGIVSKIEAYGLMEDTKCDTYEANRKLGFADDLRDFTPFTNILKQIGVQSIELHTNNPDKKKCVAEYVANTMNISCELKPRNFSYLRAKCNSKYHTLKLQNMKEINQCLPINSQNRTDKKITIVRTRWNKVYVDSMFDACYNRLLQSEIPSENIEVITVPGAFDIVAAIVLLNKRRTPDMVIALGSLLKGETDHYTFLMNALSNGLINCQIKYDMPLINGILTCETEQQLEERTIKNNLGISFANAAIDILQNGSI